MQLVMHCWHGDASAVISKPTGGRSTGQHVANSHSINRTCCAQLLHALQAAGAVWRISDPQVHHMHLHSKGQGGSCCQGPGWTASDRLHNAPSACMQPSTVWLHRQFPELTCQGSSSERESLACEGSSFMYSSPCSRTHS